jgi:hypothetical protein
MNRQSESFLAERKRNKEKLQFGYQSTYMILLGLIGFLLIYYVWILNANATQGFAIRDLENAQKQLKVELDRLDVKIAEIESSRSIESDETLKWIMEDYEDPDYLVIKENVQYVYNN